MTSRPEPAMANPAENNEADAPVARAPSEMARPATHETNAAAETAREPIAHPRTARSSASLTRGSSYRVQAGDTLSTIAARVSDRSAGGLWHVADEIFSANPRAFISGSRDLIMLGSEIRIPEARTITPAAAPSAPVAPSAEAAPPVDAAVPLLLVCVPAEG